MSQLASVTMALTTRRLLLETREHIQFLDITDEVVGLVREMRYRDGVVTVYSRHTTAAVRVQEAEPLLLEDFRAFLERMAPRDAAYRHNDFHLRSVNMLPDESPNGHSHCMHMMLGTSESIPVVDGALQFGKWQRLFVIELDGPRTRREVLVQAMGVRDLDWAS